MRSGETACRDSGLGTVTINFFICSPPRSIYFEIFGPPALIFLKYMTCNQLIAEIQKVRGWVLGMNGLVSRVSFQGLYGRVSLQGLQGGPNISGVQTSRDRMRLQASLTTNRRYMHWTDILSWMVWQLLFVVHARISCLMTILSRL